MSPRGIRLLLVLSVLAGSSCERRGVGNLVATAEAPRAPAPSASAAPVDSSAPDAPVADEIQAFVRNRVREGYDERARIIEITVDVFSGERDHAGLEQEVPKMVDAEMNLHRKLEAQWTGPTDCDRLDEAFAALEQSGIIARQKFSDCGTCGAAEIADEMTNARAAGRAVRGYVFFHDQDVDSVVGGDGLYMNYGSWKEGAPAAVAIGHEVVAALKKARLTTDWDGRIEHRIGVKLDWKKRRFTKAPAVPR